MTASQTSHIQHTLDLSGDGACYVRVSDDQQDAQRQYESLEAFLARHNINVPKSRWFVDEGWARDTAAFRPEFNRMLKLAEDGHIKWIIVDQLDRFGCKSVKQLQHYLYVLEEAGCKLYDASGKEWSAEDDATEIQLWVEGKASVKEPRKISSRVLGGMIAKARNGEWQGGAVRLGFDVGCFKRDTGEELWRVVLEGRDKRLKVYPDGQTKRFDGERNFPKHQEATDKLQLTPSNDQAKIEAAQSVFERYATESISFTALAHDVNSLGFRSCYGQPFESRSIQDMLSDPIYLGYGTFNKTHAGKFHRYKDGRAELELNLEGKFSRNHEEHWIQSVRLFEPLVKLATWNKVREKLANRSKRAKAPNSHRHYLSGLLYCGNCNCKMTSGRNDFGQLSKVEYQCGNYSKAARYRGKKKEWDCTCLRNGIFQRELEQYIDRYLEETGKRLEVLTGTSGTDHLTDRLEEKAFSHWAEFELGLMRLQMYLTRHHREEYEAIQKDSYQEDATEYEFIMACVDLYRKRFDPTAIEKVISQLEAEHDALMQQWADLPTPRAREKAKARFAELEARIDNLRRQSEDAASVVEEHYRELMDLEEAIKEAKAAMKAENNERAIRQRAEAIRKVIHRIKCRFTATRVDADMRGHRGGGWGKRGYKLLSVTIYPLVGQAFEMKAESVVSQESGSPPPNDTALTPWAAQSLTNDTNSPAVQRVSPSERL